MKGSRYGSLGLEYPAWMAERIRRIPYTTGWEGWFAKECPECDGRGWNMGAGHDLTCPGCGGDQVVFEWLTVYGVCEFCDGTGQVYSDPLTADPESVGVETCDMCQGERFILS